MRAIAISLVSAVIMITGARAVHAAPVEASPCQVHPVVFDGWQAQEMSNDWVHLTFVPQLGGRLMQVSFAGHPYLFVNPVYRGKYISPAEAAGRWINYGGDKIWPLPEGNDNEQQWPGASKALDDGAYAFSVVPAGTRCAVRLEGPPDEETGLQYTREVSIGNDSPEILFHAMTRNFTSHPITWSVQSVSQYDLADANDPKLYNHNFRAFVPLNPQSLYLNGYHVRDGLANDPSFSTNDGLFRLNWKYLENEVWLDSTAGWVALVDGASQFAMVERTKYVAKGDYPGHATVIFYKNGPVVELNPQGMPYLTPSDQKETPYYMEAELNSPMVELEPNETYAFDSKWSPTRMNGDSATVSSAALIGKPLLARSVDGRLELSGTFGVFWPGELQAFLYGKKGGDEGKVKLQDVRPDSLVELHQTLPLKNVGRVSVHLIDRQGNDRGSLGEVLVTREHDEP